MEWFFTACLVFFHALLVTQASAIETQCVYVGLVRTIYIRCIYGIFGREITKYTVIYGVYIRFWPTLRICSPVLAKGFVDMVGGFVYFCIHPREP